MWTRIAALVLLVLTLAVDAGAQEGLYIGGAYGSSDQDVSSESFQIAIGEIETSFDGSDTSGKIFVGYRLSRHFAIEGAFVDLGSVDVVTRVSIEDLPIPPLPIPIDLPPFTFDFVAEVSLEREGLAAAAVGVAPVGSRFELFGKAGLFAWQVDGRIGDTSTDGGSFTVNIDADDDGTGLMAGTGLAYLFERFSLRIEAERFFDVGDSDADLLSIGVLWRF